VLCSVLIDSDGTIAGVEVVRGVERSLDAEAMRIIEAMPKWQPGRIGDTPVPTLCLIPVSFRL
ncbi:MAG: energy transducer TonB, partial [Candidatus Amulumruptor sp.]|nr:energy transducer TonB [Candidatus Amulumruptor sp.]